MDALSADDADDIATMMELCADMLSHHLTNRDGLSARAMLVLNRISRDGPMRLTALAEAEGVSQSGMTQLVQRMERQGLLERRGDPEDGRASLIVLGAAGREFWQVRTAVHRQRVAELLTLTTHDDQVSLRLAALVVMRVLGRMRDAADQQGSVDATSD
jgi:DNA-binding MarR family transcriptional regulator